MIIKEIKGNLMEIFIRGEAEIIAHGCNCFGIMGAGLARQVSSLFPQALEVDRGVGKNGEMLEPLGDYNRLGTYTEADIPTIGKILNCYTQFQPGACFEYRALMDVLLDINTNFSGKTIYFPEIGCDAGGSWDLVKKIIHENTPDLEVIIVHHYTGTRKLEDSNKN